MKITVTQLLFHKNNFEINFKRNTELTKRFPLRLHFLNDKSLSNLELSNTDIIKTIQN